MPNIKSAKKRVKTAQARTNQNLTVKSALKTFIKKFEQAIAEGNKESISAAYKTAVKKIDQAVAKGILHKNTAARKKSQLTLKANI